MSRLSISIAVCAAMAVSLSANAATQKDSGGDSVNSWGPWEGVKTAAGPRVAQIPFRIGFVQSQNSRNAAAFEADVEQETEGGWKGYVALAKNDHSGVIGGTVDFALDPSTDSVSAIVRLKDGRVHRLNQNSHFYEGGESPALWGQSRAMDDGFKFRQFVVEGENGNYIQTSQASHWKYGVVGGDEITNGDLRLDKSDSFNSWFVAGMPTAIADIQSFNLGNVIATYSGYGYYSATGYATNTIQVDFGANTWNGSWQGPVDVQANGVVAGVGFQSTSVTGTGVTAGSVEGSFYGEGAKSLGGLLDVQKGSKHIVGTFIAEQVKP